MVMIFITKLKFNKTCLSASLCTDKKEAENE